MKALLLNQTVNYVGNDGEIRQVTVHEVVSPHTAWLTLDKDKHVAFARYSEEQIPGTFHFPGDAPPNNGAGAPKKTPPADFTPGVKQAKPEAAPEPAPALAKTT